MATLNTLRTRGALILTIAIGVALIAFLLQDLMGANSVFQSRKNRVGSIEGNNIDYVEFLNESDRLEGVIQTMYGGNSLNAAQVEQVQATLWESYLRRYSYEPGYRKLGLTVGESEQIDMVQGKYTSPVITDMFADPQTGTVDRAALAGFVGSLEQDTEGRMSALWSYVKEEMVGERSLSKFMALVQASVFVNDLEVKRSVAAANNTYNGRFAMVAFSSIADSTVTVSSSEIRDYYNAHKKMFRQGAARDVEYVSFEVAPSEKDYADAAAHVAKLAEDFAAAGDAMQFATMNSQERASNIYRSEAQLSGDELSVAFGERRGQMAGPTLTGNVYTMSRLASERMMPDSVGARHILLPLGSKVADSLVTAIKGGANIVELASQYSNDHMVDLGRFSPDQMVPAFRDKVVDAAPGSVFKVDTQYGTHVVEMTYRGTPVRKVQVATVTYNVEPSEATEQEAYNKARDFLVAAAGSKAKFDEAVTSTGANRRVATIAAGDKEVNGLADSREMVRWSFNSKVGAVSTIFDIDRNYVVAVLTSAREAGIAPVEQVSTAIAQRLRTDKKAATLSAQMAGKSIDEIGSMTGGKTGDVAALKTNGFYDQNLGVEPSVFGAIESLSAGATSNPIKGYGGVYVVSIATVDAGADATDESERVRLEANAGGMLPQRVMSAMLDRTDVEDYRAKFF